MQFLDVNGISVNYGKKNVLNDVSFSVSKGEIVGLLGKNGAGKTTLIKVLAGLTTPKSGQIFVNGKLLRSNGSAKLIGYCPQENSFFEKLTVKENIEYFGYLYKVERNELSIMVNKISYMLNLREKLNEQSGNLSGGQKRRLNIACSIVHSPEILLMDEPSLALDPVSRMNLWHLIKAINNTGTTVIVSSNNLEELRSICSHFIAIRDGSVVFNGNEGILQNSQLSQIYSQGDSQ